MSQSKVFNGSAVYCNGVAMTVISTVLVIIRRNGFRAISLTTGESVSHRGTFVMVSDDSIVIRGGKPVHVLNPEHWSGERQMGSERYTIKNGELTRVNPLQCLVGGSMTKITSALHFDYHWLDNDSYYLTVVNKSTKKPIGYQEF